MADDHNSSTVRKSQSLRVVKLGASVVPPPDQSKDANAIKANSVEKEDEYAQFYVGAQQDAGLIPPPSSPRLLRERVQSNNALSPCIEAMVTNIDGTGYDFENETEEKDDDEDDAKIDELREFFAQPWPGMSWTTMRKLLRRDLEELGNAYLEVLRNPSDEICFLKYIDGKMMRLVKLDEPAPVEQTVFRKGQKVTLTVATRERRFCQMMNGLSLVYFKEFGSKRDLDKTKGTWATKGQRLAAKDRATEVIHFSGLPDANTPYGLPRWWHQTPSVLGSRKAEEFNLEFFDNGGVPPVMIFLQGGTLAPESRQAIEAKTSGPAAKNNRVQVIEVDPSGGSLESTPQARVTVERFGAERQQDSMFEKYDERCETRVRRAFRLPPIFIGAAQDYSFATAFASYTVAEAQVFKPERDEFDAIITMKLLPAMGYDGYKQRSKPLVIEDATLKLQGIEIAIGTQQVDMQDVVEAINEVVGTHLKITDKAPTPIPNGSTHTIDGQGNIVPIADHPAFAAVGAKGPSANGSASALSKPTPPAVGAAAKAKPVGTTATARKSEGRNVERLALDTLVALRKRDIPALADQLMVMASLDEAGRAAFDAQLAEMSFVDPTLDPDGLRELSACTLQVMAGLHDHAH